MITSNSAEVQKDLLKYVDQLGKKLEAMVAGFAGEVALKASLATAVADPLTIDRAMGIYRERRDELGIAIEPGYHAGSWRYVDGQAVYDVVDDPQIRSRDFVQNAAQSEAQAQYTLGETFSIAAVGPNMGYLQKRDDINGATTVAAYAAFQVNAKNYFEGSSGGGVA